MSTRPCETDGAGLLRAQEWGRIVLDRGGKAYRLIHRCDYAAQRDRDCAKDQKRSPPPLPTVLILVLILKPGRPRRAFGRGGLAPISTSSLTRSLPRCSNCARHFRSLRPFPHIKRS